MDKLTQLFDTWKAGNDHTEFEAFQGGFTSSAVSMRSRAMAAVDKLRNSKNEALLNQVKNAIGQLSDIPE